MQRGGPRNVRSICIPHDPEAVGPAVVAALRQMSQDLEAGALVTVDPVRARLRVLPL